MIFQTELYNHELYNHELYNHELIYGYPMASQIKAKYQPSVNVLYSVSYQTTYTVMDESSFLSKGECETPVRVMSISINPAINIKILCQHFETPICSNQCHN